MSGKKRMMFSVVVGFFMMIALPLLFINREEEKISKAENRVLAQFPQRSEDGKWPKNIWELLSDWFEDNIGFRDEFMYVSSQIKYKIFGQSTSQKVEIGKGEWLFYTEFDNIELAKGTYELSDEDLKQIAVVQQEIADELSRQGILFAVTLTPSKATIYPEYIASAECKVQESACDWVKEYLSENTSVHYIDLKQDLLSKRAEELVYIPDDVHWNALGAYTGYQSIMKYLMEEGNIDAELAKVRFIGDYAQGDLSRMLGWNVKDPVYIEKSDLIVEDALYYQKDDDSLRTALEGLHPEAGKVDVFYNEGGNGKTLLFVGDSMFGSKNFITPFAQSFSKVVYLWSGIFKQDTIDLAEPDVVLFEITERGARNIMYDEFQ